MSIYTQKVTEQLIDLYINKGVPVEEIAEILSTKKRGVVAKLSSLGLYEKKVYTSKLGNRPIRKAEYIERLAVLLGVPLIEVESLEKASKGALKLLVDELSQQCNNAAN